MLNNINPYNQAEFEKSFKQSELYKKLCQDLGVDSFLLDPSDRFDEQTLNFLPEYENLIGERFVTQERWKKENIISRVDPRCGTGREHFITAEGYYSPCCYVADHRFYYKTQFGKNKKLYDIRQTTLSQLLAESAVIDFYKTLPQHGVCQFNCPDTESSV